MRARPAAASRRNGMRRGPTPARAVVSVIAGLVRSVDAVVACRGAIPLDPGRPDGMVQRLHHTGMIDATAGRHGPDDARRPVHAGTATMPIQGRINAALLATPAIPHPYRIVEDQ
jgi:hypothetical protein